MHVSREVHGYSFQSAAQDGLIDVRMTLQDDGREELSLVVQGAELHPSPIALEPGSICRVIGPKRWSDFIRLRSRGRHHMFLCREVDPGSRTHDPSDRDGG